MADLGVLVDRVCDALQVSTDDPIAEPHHAGRSRHERLCGARRKTSDAGESDTGIGAMLFRHEVDAIVTRYRRLMQQPVAWSEEQS